MADLDKTDYKILEVLQKKARITNLQLSQEIGLSPAPTLERVRKLEQAGYIEGYHAILSEEKLGLQVKTFLLVQLDFHKNNALQIFMDTIQAIPAVIECSHVTGQADYILKILVKDMKAYEQLIMNNISKIPVLKTFQTMMILSTPIEHSLAPLNY